MIRGGCAYDIGRAAITHTSRHEDGRASGSLIPEYIYEELGINRLNECLGRLYAIGKQGIASFAPLVFRAYDNRDKAAEKILKENTVYIASAPSSAAKEYGRQEEPMKAVIIGGLIKNGIFRKI